MSYIQVRISEEEKAEAQAVLESMGLTMSGGIKLFLRQVIDQQKLPFSVTKTKIKKMPTAPKIELEKIKVPEEKIESSSHNNFEKWNLFQKREIG
jgi:DNA-damage-inducible protein J